MSSLHKGLINNKHVVIARLHDDRIMVGPGAPNIFHQVDDILCARVGQPVNEALIVDVLNVLSD